METPITVGKPKENDRFREATVVHDDMFERIISLENLVVAWREFRIGKRSKKDVIEFGDRVEEHLVALALDLKAGKYRHGQYTRFIVHDPKRREISKAPVRDRVLHHAMCRVIGPVFDRGFIFDSYANRTGKGTLSANDRFDAFVRKCSRNGSRTAFVLKADIRKYFDSVDHETLLHILGRRIRCERTLGLLHSVVSSFETSPGKGIPLGNLTSQLFSNAYLDPFDQFVKRELGVKYYIRYADDFVVLSDDVGALDRMRSRMDAFLTQNLGLTLHPEKTRIVRFGSGVDFLGKVHFRFHRVLRVKTKRRSIRRIASRNESSYIGLLRHSRSHGLVRILRDILEQKNVLEEVCVNPSTKPSGAWTSRA